MQKASVGVSIQAPADNVTIDCPPFVATTEEFRCTVTVQSGTSLQMDVDYADASTESFPITGQ